MKHTIRLFLSLATLAMFINVGSALAEETTPTTTTPATTSSTAKNKRGAKRGEQAGGGERQVLKDLNLTKDQKAKVAAITKKEATDLKAVNENTALSGAEKRTKVTAIREAARAEIRALLTPEQKEKFDKAVAASAQETQKKKGNRRNR